MQIMAYNTEKKYDETIYCECESLMVQRKNKTTGALFYGCSQYPKCTFTETLEEVEEGLSLRLHLVESFRKGEIENAKKMRRDSQCYCRSGKVFGECCIDITHPKMIAN